MRTDRTGAAPTEDRRAAPSSASALSAPVSRRLFVHSALGAGALIVLGTTRYLPGRTLCRPPGGQDEGRLTSSCVHCERCREACPATAVATAHIEDGILNARTPCMDFKQGWCDFCEDDPRGPRCVAVCPTDALLLEEGRPLILGTAVLNRDWCLAAKGMDCRACFDACPYEAMSIGSDHVPEVDGNACNGCGACEFSCVSMSAGSLTVGATDRAIVIVPLTAANEKARP